MAQEQNSGRIPGIIGALGKFLKGLKEYNLLELLKVLFVVFVFALLISFVRNPEMYIEKASYAFELHDLTGADRAWMLEPQKLLSAL